MNEQECSFCKSIRMQKYFAERFSRPGVKGKVTVTYEAALVEHSFIVCEEEEIPTGRFTDYGYKLRYCPQCARDLSKDISEEGVFIYDSTRNDEQDS